MAIHRFKCSTELNNEIIKFAEIHYNDEDKTLKEQFNDWLKRENISQLVENENNFLKRHNYDTSTIDVKIFKSIKYYYINKIKNTKTNASSSKEDKNKRLITRLPIELLEKIKEDLEKHFTENPKFKPADTYEQFEISEEFSTISKEVIKKCYKNQYYQIKHKKYADTL
jgi:hypothetical protein